MVIYPTQVTRLKDFLLKFMDRYESCEGHLSAKDLEVVDFYFGDMQNTAQDLHEMLQLELVPVGAGAEERRGEQ